MNIVVICNEAQKAELVTSGIEESAAVWLNDSKDLPAADVIIDLLFRNTPDRIAALRKAPLAIINSVVETVADIHPSFVRINGWSSFLKNRIIEAAGNEAARATATEALAQLNKSVEWLPDEPGFITPRVVSMIINEAYHTLAEGVSTKEEIDTAMKLGTAYPYGPFEWSSKIGLTNIAALLHRLGSIHDRYNPCSLLVEEAI